MQADVLFDATPLDRDHAARGIGAAVRGIAEGLAALPNERRPAFLSSFEVAYRHLLITGKQA